MTDFEMDSYHRCMEFIIPALTLAEHDDWESFHRLMGTSDVDMLSVLITLMGSWLQLADAVAELTEMTVAEVIQYVALLAKEVP